MLRIPALLAALIMMACMFGIGVQAEAATSKPRVILAPITDTSVPEQGKVKADGMTDAIRTGLKEALFKCGKFTLIADTDLQKDLDAERYNQYLSGDFNPAQAAAIGQKVGAQALVKCTIVQNQMSSKVKDMILVKEIENRMELSVAVEICDIGKATISFMHTAPSDQKSKSKELSLDSKNQKPMSMGSTNDVRAMAANDIVKQLADAIIKNAVKEKGKGTVTKVSGGGMANDSIVVDIGSNAGADVDMEVAIMCVDEDGFEEAIGKASITNIQEDKAKCLIVKTKRPVALGDIVQIAGGGSGSTASSGKEVTSDTIAIGQGMNKDAAINDALTQAIQQAAGAYIMSEQEAKNYEMVKNEMFLSTKGFISNYDLVGTPETDGGITTVRVKATVSSKPIYEALLSKRIIGRQRVMVIVPEQHLKLVVPDPAGETEIIKNLIDRSFEVVDQKMSKDIRENEQMRAQLKGDANAVLALIGNKTDAEILIYGEAFSEGAQRINTASGQKWTCGARVEIRAVETDTGRILYADAEQATMVDATEALAGKRALKAVAELLCKGTDVKKGFVDQIADKLLDTTHYVQCVVSGLTSEADLSTAENALREAIGNRPIHRFSYRDGIAKINLETSKTAQDITGAISKVQIKGKLNLVSNTVNRIDLEYSN